tara:strand:+ start:72 stop:407 length:336 start_codon:yes stop_codon:yes gene_type:complete
MKELLGEAFPFNLVCFRGGYNDFYFEIAVDELRCGWYRRIGEGDATRSGGGMNIGMNDDGGVGEEQTRPFGTATRNGGGDGGESDVSKFGRRGRGRKVAKVMEKTRDVDES